MLRTALKLAGAGLFVLFLAVALAFALVQTGPGKTWLAGLIGRLLSDPAETVTVRGLVGFLPFDIRVEDVTIADAAGPRLVIEGAAVDISAIDLLRGRLTIHDLTARTVRFERSGTGTTPIGAFLNPPLPVTVQHLAIDTLSLGPAILGTPITLAIHGNAALGGGRIGANLAVTRTDAPGHAELHVAYGGTPERLQLTATIAEPSGAVLAGLLHESMPVPLTLELAGDGPLADWNGHLHVAAGRAGLGATFRIVGDVGYRLTADGAAELQPLLPSPWRPIIGPRVPFSIEVRFAPEGAVMLDHLSLTAAATTITGQGSYARKNDQLAGTLTLAAPALTDFEPLLGEHIAGAGTATLALSGKLSRPLAEATIDIQEPRVAAIGARRATAVAEIAPQGDPLDAATPIDVNAHGRILAVTGVPSLPAELATAIDWHGQARLDRATGHLSLSDVVIGDNGATLSLAADADHAGATGTARLAVPDLSPLTEHRLGGALDVTADISAAADGSGTAVLSGAIDQPKTGDARLDALLGARLALNGTLRRLGDGTLTASDMTVTGARFRLTGSGRRQADGRLAADYHLDLPQLAALDARLAGKAEADGHLEGPADALSGTMTLKGKALAAGSAHVDDLAATLAIADLQELRGSLTGRFRAGSLDGTFSATTALAPGNILRVPQIAIAAAGAQVGGALSINLSSSAIDGKIDGRVPDLRSWSTFAGTPLGGSLDLHAALQGQALDLAVNGRGVSWGTAPASIQSVALTARLTDLLHRPRGRAELTLSGGAVGRAKLARVHLLGTAAQAGHFAITADAQGTVSGPFRLGATASAVINNSALDLHVTQLSGTLAGAPLGLRQPLEIAWQGGAGSFTDLALGLGRGQLDGEGRLAGTSIALHLHAAHLPVAALARLGGRENFAGDLGFEITLGGTRLHPEGQIVVDAERLRLATASQPDLPMLGVVASATWRNDTVQFKGRVAGLDNAAVGFSGNAPLVLDPKRLAVHMPPSGALALHVEGGGNLANLADLLPLGESRLTGRFAVDAAVSGTVGDPQASGRLTINGARYESLTAGTILSGMNFTLVGDRDRLVLQNFTANDGAQGALVLRGSVNLAATPGPAFDVSAALRHFRAIQRDELTATASGELRLTGTVAAPQLAAQLTIDQATINLPERLPQSAQPIPVVRIDSVTGRTLSTPNTTQASSPLWAVSLDVHVSAPGQIFVRGHGLDSVWRGAITATGTTAAPQLTGRLDVVRGSYDFLGKSFSLSRGTIAFLGGQKIDPTLNIEARGTSSDITAIVQLGGTVTQPTIKLSSAPQLPEDEILARVLFGTSISQISPAQGIQLAQAAASLAGGTNLSVLDTIRRGLGLDRLSIGSQQNSVLPNIGVPSLSAQPGVPGSGPAIGAGTTPLPPGAATDAAGVAGTTVTAGKYVANGVYVGVSQGFTPGSSTVNAQIDVTRHISINTQASQAGGSGVGVDWKLDY